MSWASDLTLDPNEPSAYDPETGDGSIAVEMVAPGVTSEGFPSEVTGLIEAALAENPHIGFVDLTRRGYVILDLNQDRAHADWFLFDDVISPDVAAESFARGVETRSGENHLTLSDEPAPPKSAPEGAP